MDKQVNREALSKLEAVNNVELTNVTGGVGPVFDISKVEGPKLPSWYLPVSPKLSITTIR